MLSMYGSRTKSLYVHVIFWTTIQLKRDRRTRTVAKDDALLDPEA